jgi:hypothetical protein
MAVTEEGRKIFFFPCFARPREEERLLCRSKRHLFGLFFLTVYETAVLDKTRRFI